MSDVKKGRGRPKSNDAEVLVQILANPDVLSRYKAGIATIQNYMREIESAQAAIKDVIADIADNTGLSKGFLKKTADADLNEKTDTILAEAEAIVDGVEMLTKGSLQSRAAETEEF